MWLTSACDVHVYYINEVELASYIIIIAIILCGVEGVVMEKKTLARVTASFSRFIRTKRDKITWEVVKKTGGWYATRIAVVVLWCAVLWAILGDDALPVLQRNETRRCLPVLSDLENSSLNSGALDDLVDAVGANATALLSDTFTSVSTQYILLYNASNRSSVALVDVAISEQCPSLVEASLSVTVPGNSQNISVLNTTRQIDLAEVIQNTLAPHVSTSLLDVPEGHFFALVVLVIAASIGGFLTSLIHLPPLLGMLIAGFILANVPHISIANNISSAWSSSLRNIALVVILTRGGLSLDAKQLRRLKFAVPLLAFTPCLLEGAIDGLVAIFYLQMPWQWGLLLG